MQSTSFQSAPCASPEEAAASAAAMAALSAPSGMEHRVVKTIVQEINGLFVAVVVVELVEIENKAEAEARPAENHQDEPIYGENDAPDNIYWIAGFNSRELQEFHPFPDAGQSAPHMPDMAPDAVPDTAVAAAPQNIHDDSYYMSGLYFQDMQLAEQAISALNEEPVAPPVGEAMSMNANLQQQPPRGEDDGGDGDGEGGDDGKGRRRDHARNPHAPPADPPAPAPPA
jgi:hypothetical protein